MTTAAPASSPGWRTIAAAAVLLVLTVVVVALVADSRRSPLATDGDGATLPLVQVERRQPAGGVLGLAVPVRAVVDTDGAASVQTFTPAGEIVSVPVVLGVSGAGWVAISALEQSALDAPLAEGDDVLLTPVTTP